jgi:hypothetical protein
MNRGKFTLLAFCVMAVGVVLFSATCSPSSNSHSSEIPNHQADVAYVGKAVCGSCHPDHLATFLHTGMGRSFDRATPRKSAATGFGKQVHDPNSSLSYQANWKGSTLMIQELIDSLPLVTQPVTYIVGSGQHTNSHIINRNGLLFQAPMTYYVQDSTWDLPPGFELNNSRFNRQLGEECIACHNSMPEMDGNSQFRFLTVGSGIDCERCHGPGELHVEHFSRANADTVEGRKLIVNPQKLSWERQIDVCQRCHLQGNTILKPGKRYTDFRPGMKLSDIFEIYLPEYQTDGQHFDMANHAARFQQSECFIQSNSESDLKNGGLTFSCISCHNPHVSVKKTESGTFNATCINCHSNDGCEELLEVRQEQNDNCVGCHMPMRGSQDIPHVSIHDHKIQVPGDTIHKKINSSTTLVCVNNPDPDDQTEAMAYLTYWEKFDKNPIYLEEAQNRIGAESALRIRIYLAYLQENWQQIQELSAALNPEEQTDYWMCFQIAKSGLELEQLNDALKWFKRSNELEPYHLETKIQYASALFRLGDHTEAIELLKQVVSFNPYHQQGLNNLGVVLLRKEQYNKALGYLRQCTRLYPNYLEGWENLADAYLRLGRTNELRATLERIQSLDPEHPTAGRLLKRMKE